MEEHHTLLFAAIANSTSSANQLGIPILNNITDLKEEVEEDHLLLFSAIANITSAEEIGNIILNNISYLGEDIEMDHALLLSTIADVISSTKDMFDNSSHFEQIMNLSTSILHQQSKLDEYFNVR